MARPCSISKSRAIATAASATRPTAVLERRVAALEGGVDALCVSSGQAAVHYATLNVTELGSNIVSVPQLYGTTHTLFAHLLPSQGVTVRFAASDRPRRSRS